MTVEGDAEALIENAIPGVAPVKIAAIAIAAVLLLGLLGFMAWKTFFAAGQAQAKHDVVQAQGQQAISAAGAAAGKDAVPIITNNYNYAAKSDKQTEENQHAILQAPGAGQLVDPALDALVRRDICMRPSARGLPQCEQLFGSHP